MDDTTAAESVFEAGRALTESEATLRGIIALASEAVVSTDENFRITLFNAAAERVFGYSADEVIGEPLEFLLPEKSRHAHASHVQRFARDTRDARTIAERGRIWGRRRDGQIFPAEASISRLRVGNVTHYTAMLRDVTAQRRAEERMEFLAQASEVLHSSLAYEETFGALLRLVVPELATYCIADVVDEAGRVRRLHVVHGDAALQPLADRLCSYPRSQARYLTSRAIQAGVPELIAHVSDELLESVAENEEHLAIMRALAPRSLMIVPLRARAQVLGAIVFARDASAEPYDEDTFALAVELAHRAASALDNAQLYRTAQRAIQARDDVLGVVSHDLRNPLSVISMCAASLLSAGVIDEASTREGLQTVQQSARWAQRLIQDLLDVTTIEAGGLSLDRQAVDPVLLVTQAAVFLEEIAAGREISIITELPEHLPTVVVDADRIHQAMGNLVGNALKFTPRGGEVHVGASTTEHSVRIFVSDNGPGIPPEDVPFIFDRFWTARRDSRVRGTGMGLAIVRGIVQAHGGEVHVEPRAGGGATFVLTLPRADVAR